MSNPFKGANKETDEINPDIAKSGINEEENSESKNLQQNNETKAEVNPDAEVVIDEDTSITPESDQAQNESCGKLQEEVLLREQEWQRGDERADYRRIKEIHGKCRRDFENRIF